MNYTNIYYIPYPNILVKITWHEPKAIPSHSATSVIVFDLLSPNHAIMLSIHYFCLTKCIRMLITFYGSVPIFKEAQPIKNLPTAHGLLVKGSFIHFVLLVPIFLSFTQKFSCRHCSVLLGMTNTTHDTNTALYL